MPSEWLGRPEQWGRRYILSITEKFIKKPTKHYPQQTVLVKTKTQFDLILYMKKFWMATHADRYQAFSYLRQENFNRRGVPTFSVWYRAWLSGTVAWLSGTGSLVFPFVLLFIYVSNYDVTTQSATFPATSEGCRDVKKYIIGIFLFKMPNSMRYEKNNQVPMLNPDRQISVSGDTMSHPSLGYRLDWYLWHRITLDWDLSVWIQHWYLILLHLHRLIIRCVHVFQT